MRAICLTICLAPLLASAGQRPVASVTLEPQGAASDAVAIFAHPFRRGDVKGEPIVAAKGKGQPAQVQVKRRYRDGSVKHALFAVPLGETKPGQQVTLDLLDTPNRDGHAAPPPKLPEGFEAEVLFRFPDGSEARASATKFLGAAGSRSQPYRLEQWLDGPVVAERQVGGPPVKGVDSDRDIHVIFGLRTFRGAKRVRIEVVVENPWADTPGNIPYDVQVLVGGKEVFAQKNVGRWDGKLGYWIKDKDPSLGHFAHARWRKVFWWGDPPPEVHVRYDLAYLVSTGLLPPYDPSVAVPRQAIDKTLKRWRPLPRGILANGLVTAYFPTTGGRWDIGPYPAWTTRYLLAQDPALWQVVLSTADLAGSFSVHHRDRGTGRLLSLDDHPGYSLNPRGTREKIPPRAAPGRPYVRRPGVSPYSVDCAHQPSLAFGPYLLTGERYYLDEMYFWANWCMLTQNADYRKQGRGLVAPDQIRGEAWALRQMVDAAKLAPDAHPEKAYFDAKAKSNLAFYNAFITGPDATPLGTYTVGASDAYVRGRPQPERRKWLTMAPWQQNFLAWSLDHAARAGYAEAAAPRDYFARCQIGMLTRPEAFDPLYATPYFLVVGERIDGKIRWYRTWEELFEKTFRVVAPGTKPPLPRQDYGSSYAYIARAVLVLGKAAGVDGSEQALAVLERHLPKRAQVLADDPTWAFAP